MAYTTIPSTDIEVGKPVKKSLWDKIKANFTDHETRIDGLEEGANKVEIFNFEVMGYVNNYTASELVQIGTFRAFSDTTITEGKLILMNGTNSATSSSAGVLSIDLQKSTDNGVTWNTILVSVPEIADGVSATGSESALITFITGGEDLLAEELLRVNVVSKKDTQGTFLISVYGDIA